jgi:hypothetical protein
MNTERSEATKPTGKQLLSWATGDRDREADALANQTEELTDLSKDEALPAAKVAVADAHGDTGVSETDPERSDIADPTDVAEVADQGTDPELGPPGP